MPILKLPHWVIPDKFSARFDIESSTPIEMTGRLYAKMNELIESYNEYVEEVNKAIEDYEAANDKDFNCFTQTVKKLISDYIGMVDLKIIQHDRKFEEYYKSFTAEIIKTTQNIIAELKENGELDATLLEAVANLETKFTTFKNEANAIIDEIKAANVSFENEIKALQTTFFENAEARANALESDYQSTKNALRVEYNDIKGKLTVDYLEAKEELATDYQNAKNDFAGQSQNVADLIYTIKRNKFRHYTCIYGVTTLESGTEVRFSFNFSFDNHYPNPYTDPGSALRQLPPSKRHLINGFFNDNNLEIQLNAGCYQLDGETAEEKYWIFCPQSVNGYLVYAENGEPFNLFNHLEDMKIIDDVYDLYPTIEYGDSVNE